MYTQTPPPTHTRTRTQIFCMHLLYIDCRVTEVDHTKRFHVAKKIQIQPESFLLAIAAPLHFMPLSPYKTSCPIFCLYSHLILR